GWHGGPRGRAWRGFPAPVSEGCFSYLVFAGATGTLRRGLSRTNQPAPPALAIPLRTNENLRPRCAGYKARPCHINVRYRKLVPLPSLASEIRFPVHREGVVSSEL